MGVSPFPNGKLFEIHGNELKPDPVGNLGQASVLSIPHGVLLFGVRKDAFACTSPDTSVYSGRRRPVPHNPSRYAAVPFSHKSWSEYKDGASDSLHIPVDCSCIPGIHPG